jgi:hypothetical protein
VNEDDDLVQLSTFQLERQLCMTFRLELSRARALSRARKILHLLESRHARSEQLRGMREEQR